MRHTRTFCLAAAATAAAFGLTACGGAGTGSGAGTKSVSAASPVTAPKTASVADAMALVSKQTASDTSAKMTLTETVPKVGTISSSGSVSTKPLAMDMTMSDPQLTQELGTSSIRMLFSGDTMYMDLGSKSPQGFGGKHWMKLDLASLGTAGQSMSSLMNQSSSQGPATMVKLISSSGDVRQVGQETVDGQQTTHYSGVVDVDKLLTETFGADNADLKTVTQQLSSSGVTTETVNMWVNAQNLPVRFQESASTSAGPMSATVDYSDYSSAPLRITPPPAGDTVDFAQLLKQAQQP